MSTGPVVCTTVHTSSQKLLSVTSDGLLIWMSGAIALLLYALLGLTRTALWYADSNELATVVASRVSVAWSVEVPYPGVPYPDLGIGPPASAVSIWLAKSFNFGSSTAVVTCDSFRRF